MSGDVHVRFSESERVRFPLATHLVILHRDLAALLEACLQVNGISFDIFYGVSANTWNFWDITNSRETLGWIPKDNAEIFR